MVVEDLAGEQHEVPIDENTYLHMRQLHAHRTPLPVAPANGGSDEDAVAAIAGGGAGWLELLQNRGASIAVEPPQEVTEESDDPGEYHSVLDEEEGAPQI